MPWKPYRGPPGRRRGGRAAALAVLLFILVLALAAWFILQDALVFTPEGAHLDLGSLFGAKLP